jgi:hypothetical protein
MKEISLKANCPLCEEGILLAEMERNDSCFIKCSMKCKYEVEIPQL